MLRHKLFAEDLISPSAVSPGLCASPGLVAAASQANSRDSSASLQNGWGTERKCTNYWQATVSPSPEEPAKTPTKVGQSLSFPASRRPSRARSRCCCRCEASFCVDPMWPYLCSNSGGGASSADDDANLARLNSCSREPNCRNACMGRPSLSEIRHTSNFPSVSRPTPDCLCFLPLHA